MFDKLKSNESSTDVKRVKTNSEKNKVLVLFILCAPPFRS